MINLSEFNETVLDENPTGIYIVRFEDDTPYGKGWFNGVVFNVAGEDEITVITEDERDDLDTLDIVGWVDIKEINLATMTIIANSIKRRYDL